MHPDDLAALLADRLGAVVPEGIHVEAADGMLWYSAEPGRFPGQQGNYDPGSAGSHVRDSFGVHGDTPEENIVGVAVRVLDELQDYVSEATHDPWPGTTSQPRPHARIRGSWLYLWYGDPGEPLLSCEPVLLAGIG